MKNQKKINYYYIIEAQPRWDMMGYGVCHYDKQGKFKHSTPDEKVKTYKNYSCALKLAKKLAPQYQIMVECISVVRCREDFPMISGTRLVSINTETGEMKKCEY